MRNKKMAMMFFSILFTFLFMMPAYAQEQANEPIKIFLGKNQIHFTAQPIKEGDTLMVPLSEMMKALGADVYEVAPQTKYAVVKENKQYNFTVGDSNVTIIEKDGTFIDTGKMGCSPAPMLKDNVVYVPVDVPDTMLKFTHYVKYISEANMIMMDCFISQEEPNMPLVTSISNNTTQNNTTQNNTAQHNTTQSNTIQKTTTSGAIQLNGIKIKEYKKDTIYIPEWIHEDLLRQYTSLSIVDTVDGNNAYELLEKGGANPKRLLYFKMPQSLRGWTPKAEMEIEISVDGVRMKMILSPYLPTRFKLNANDLMAKGWISTEKDGIAVEDTSASTELDAQIEDWMKNNPGAYKMNN